MQKNVITIFSRCPGFGSSLLVPNFGVSIAIVSASIHHLQKRWGIYVEIAIAVLVKHILYRWGYPNRRGLLWKITATFQISKNQRDQPRWLHKLICYHFIRLESSGIGEESSDYIGTKAMKMIPIWDGNKGTNFIVCMRVEYCNGIHLAFINNQHASFNKHYGEKHLLPLGDKSTKKHDNFFNQRLVKPFKYLLFNGAFEITVEKWKGVTVS